MADRYQGSILIDMDGVLVDFVSGACSVHGVTRTQLEEYWPVCTWSITKPMGDLRRVILRESVNLLGQEFPDFTDSDLWAPINNMGPEFWIGLQPLPWIDQLIKAVEETGMEWHIISDPSPACSLAAYDGKCRWLKNYFGNDFDRFALTPHKHLFASRKNMLIDDKKENVDKFTEAGGMGILFPARCNHLHKHADNPVPVMGNYESKKRLKLLETRKKMVIENFLHPER